VIARWFACFALLALSSAAAPAHAELSGAVDGRFLVGLAPQRYGGGVLAELWGRRGVVRPGAAFGILAASEGDDESSLFLTPLGFSLAITPSGDASGFIGIARLGGYLGAIKGGLTTGGFASASAGYAIALGEGASVRFTADVWGILGGRDGVFVGPAFGLGF
jgi:hypothetical protein